VLIETLIFSACAFCLFASDSPCSCTNTQEVETHEVQVLRDDLSSCRAQLASHTGATAALRQCVLSAAQALAPEALGAAFSYKERHLLGFSANTGQYEVCL
jgi:hypothetical protein